MIPKRWEQLPECLRLPEVKPYYEILRKKRALLLCKRLFDLLFALILTVLLAVPMALIALLVRLDSPGPVLYRQERVTVMGRRFRIHKFRTMVRDAEKLGASVTSGDDSRITRMGRILRRLRLDELPQLADVLRGDMSFVGTRPEAVKYVESYEPEYMATLLLPAGITSEASIRYKDEAELLSAAADPDAVYIRDILPGKMKWNLKALREFRLSSEFATMRRTCAAVLGKEYR